MKLPALSLLAVVLLGVSACTHMQSRPVPGAPGSQAPTSPAAEPPAASQTSPPPATSSQPSTSPPVQGPSGAGTAPKRPPARPAPPPTNASPPTNPPSATNKTKPVTPPTSGTTPAPGSQPPTTAGSSARTDSTPTLNLGALEQRLRDTSAIGLFTKLSLKNQVDDLLKQFRGFHDKQSATPLSDLRQRYDSLLNKVLSLLQSGDPDLAKAVSTSREAIWGILSDPQKFAAI